MKTLRALGDWGVENDRSHVTVERPVRALGWLGLKTTRADTDACQRKPKFLVSKNVDNVDFKGIFFFTIF